MTATVSLAVRRARFQGEFRQRLRRHRLRRELSMHELGRLTGLSRQQIQQYEHGDYTPTLLSACLLADALEISLDDLVGRRTYA